MNVLILSPTAPPAPGGASQWCVQLAHGLAKAGIEDVRILTERHPDATEVDRNFIRRFPFRAGAPIRGPSAYFRFGAQQSMLSVDVARRFGDVDAVIVHGSFYYYPTPLRWLPHSVPALVDLRDPMVDAQVARRMRRAKCVVACSESTLVAARSAGVAHPQLIPIPFSPLAYVGNAPELPVALRNRYVLFTNGTNHAKGIDRAVALAGRLRRRGLVDGLVVVGRRRERCELLERAIAARWAIHLGALAHPQALGLIVGAALVLVLSTVEGLPRVALETISLEGTPVLPRDVPEFSRHLPNNVVDPRNASETERVACRLLTRPSTTVDYPLHLHEPARVGASYVKLLDDMRRS